MKLETESGIEQRSARRRARIVAHMASGFEDADKWDFEYWQSRTPEERLSALVALRRDWTAIRTARSNPRSRK
jgi:hypothetical protein